MVERHTCICNAFRLDEISSCLSDFSFGLGLDEKKMVLDVARLKVPVIFLCASILTIIAVHKLFHAHVHYALSFGDSLTNFSSSLFEKTLDLATNTGRHNDTGTVVDPRYYNVSVMISGCGSPLFQAMLVVKSIFIASLPTSSVKIYFFTEKANHNKTRLDFEKLASSLAFREKRISLELLEPAFPNVGSAETQEMWKTMWRPCATQRLFIQDVLPNVDAMIYIDSDTRFLAPVQRMWHHFHQMTESQIMGMAQEHEMEMWAWYKKDRRPPHVDPLGVNSGVLLMNLTRMRAVNFTGNMLMSYERYEKELVFHDQDLLNIYFNQHPEQLYRLPCTWNYRTHHCMRGISNCPSAEQNGVMLIHGNAGTLFAGPEMQKQFPEINSAIEKYNPNEDFEKAFRQPLRETLLSLDGANMCKTFYLKGLGMEY